ncbi:IS6 family transposase [Roseomonas chloroacetimidivorans]|uniref:IS6 family transposase n=1 Tax=Roseomonas chloroacetimidivorans TaxID=1766656 RepID=UPI003C71D4CF
MLNRAQYPSDVIALVVLWRLRYRLTLRDLTEMFLLRGIVFSHEAVRDWEARLAPALAGELRQRRRGRGRNGRRSWHVDETYLKVRGRWCYLYRAIDRNGDLVDTMLSEHRDMAAAKAFFRSAKSATGIVPDKVTTDGHGSYPRAIRSTLGRRVTHRTSVFKTYGPPRLQGFCDLVRSVYANVSVCGWPPVLQEESWRSSSGSRLQSCVRPSARHDGRRP